MIRYAETILAVGLLLAGNDAKNKEQLQRGRSTCWSL
jgi:hypothetical protein